MFFIIRKHRIQACKTPIKPSDRVRFYTKEELRKGVLLPDGSRLKIPSPNLFDACVVSLDKDSIISKERKWAKLNYKASGIV